MSFKTTYILFAILLFCLALFGAMLIIQRPAADKSFVFPSLNCKKPDKLEEINPVEIDRRNGDKLVLFRGEAGWFLRRPKLALDAGKVGRLIDSIAHARLDEDLDLRASLDQYGLDKPAAVV